MPVAVGDEAPALLRVPRPRRNQRLRAFSSRAEPTPRPGLPAAPGSPAAIEAWRTMLDRHWSEIEFVSVEVAPTAGSRGGTHAFTVRLKLGAVPPEAVRVELYAEPIESTVPAGSQWIVEEEKRGGPSNDAIAPGTCLLPGAIGVTPPELHLMTPEKRRIKKEDRLAGIYTYRVTVPALRPVGDYTPRVVPWHPGVSVPLEAEPHPLVPIAAGHRGIAAHERRGFRQSPRPRAARG